jgi:hypothetical protein
MRRHHEPTFLPSGRRLAPQVPVYGSPQQVIGRTLPVPRDAATKVTFTLSFTTADGRKPVTFEIAAATIDRVFGLTGYTATDVFERHRGRIQEVAAAIYFRGRRTTLTADDFRRS